MSNDTTLDISPASENEGSLPRRRRSLTLNSPRSGVLSPASSDGEGLPRARKLSVDDVNQLIERQMTTLPSYQNLRVHMEDDRGKRCHIYAIIPYDSVGRRYWSYFMALLVLYTLYLIPMDLAFDLSGTSPTPLLVVDIFVTLCFAANIVVHFRTEIEDDLVIIRDPDAIADYYFHRWFVLDLISTIPWDLLLASVIGSSASSALNATRLLRLARLLRLLSSDGFSVEISKTEVRLLTTCSYALAFAHWMGCLWYYVSEIEGFTGTGIVADQAFSEESLGYRYLLSLHWGMWALIGMGGELKPETNLQTALAIVIICGGVYVFATLIGNIEVLLTQKAQSSIRFQERIQDLNEFISHRKISHETREDIMGYLVQIWRTQHGLGEADLLNALPTEMRNRVHREIYRKQIQECSFFQECDRHFVDALCCELTPEVCLESDFIIRQGSLGSEMYIIHRGTAQAIDEETGTIFVTLEEGDFFGEIALFTNQKRTASVKAITLLEVFVLKKLSFLRVLEYFPREALRFYEVAKERAFITGYEFEDEHDEDEDEDEYHSSYLSDEIYSDSSLSSDGFSSAKKESDQLGDSDTRNGQGSIEGTQSSLVEIGDDSGVSNDVSDRLPERNDTFAAPGRSVSEDNVQARTATEQKQSGFDQSKELRKSRTVSHAVRTEENEKRSKAQNQFRNRQSAYAPMVTDSNRSSARERSLSNKSTRPNRKKVKKVGTGNSDASDSNRSSRQLDDMFRQIPEKKADAARAANILKHAIEGPATKYMPNTDDDEGASLPKLLKKNRNRQSGLQSLRASSHDLSLRQYPGSKGFDFADADAFVSLPPTYQEYLSLTWAKDPSHHLKCNCIEPSGPQIHDKLALLKSVNTSIQLLEQRLTQLENSDMIKTKLAEARRNRLLEDEKHAQILQDLMQLEQQLSISRDAFLSMTSPDGATSPDRDTIQVELREVENQQNPLDDGQGIDRAADDADVYPSSTDNEEERISTESSRRSDQDSETMSNIRREINFDE